MALDVDALAGKINQAIGATDKDGNPISTTDYMRVFAKAVFDTYKAGLVANAPGTITGSAPPVSPLTGGAGSNGLMVLIPAIWIADMMTGFPKATGAFIPNEANASTTYSMASGKVSFASGNITGNSTATPLSPGILSAGAGSNGKIGSLVGNTWGDQVKSAAFPNGDSTLIRKVYTAVADYIQTNSSVTYASGSVTGSFAIASGPLLAGTGIGGTIS